MAGPIEGHDGRLVLQDRWELRFRYWLCVVIAVLSAAILPFRVGHTKTLAEVTEAARTSAAGVFGSFELKSKSLEALPQWRRVLTNFLTELAAFSRCIADSTSCTTEALTEYLIAKSVMRCPAQGGAGAKAFGRCKWFAS